VGLCGARCRMYQMTLLVPHIPLGLTRAVCSGLSSNWLSFLMKNSPQFINMVGRATVLTGNIYLRSDWVDLTQYMKGVVHAYSWRVHGKHYFEVHNLDSLIVLLFVFCGAGDWIQGLASTLLLSCILDTFSQSSFSFLTFLTGVP
jgi:hypothetical protein